MFHQAKPKIFAINEFEVWAAHTLKDAVRASMALSGLGEDYTLDPYHAKELSLKEASKRYVISPDGDRRTLLDLYLIAQTIPCLLHTLEP